MIPIIVVVYLMCMPMGYIVGKNFVNYKANQHENTIDQETERSNYSFIPIATSIFLPFASVLAIFQMMKDL